MGLIDKLRKGAITGLLAGGLFLQGCGSSRSDDSRFSYCAIPFVGVAFKTEKFKEHSNEIENATEVFITGNGCDLKYYREKMKYNEMWRARVQTDSDKLLVEHYDSGGRLIKRQEGLPDDAPVLLMIRFD